MTEAKLTQSDLSEALTRVELRETALLSWGAVNASFTRPELLAIVGDGLPGHLDPAEVLDRMIEHTLVVETPEGGLRSRMAETVRLLATLRQSFRNQRWWEAPPWSSTSVSCTARDAGRSAIPPEDSGLISWEQ